MYALRDASGQFVATSRSRASAHRASRRAKHLGSSVNRAGAKSEMTVLLAAVGNPDFGEPLDIGVPRSMVPVESFRSASNAVLGYIARNNLGGGNWAGGQVFKDGRQVAHVSYNGRVWKGKSWKSGQKPLYEAGAANRILPRHARRFAPSENFSAIVRTRLGMAADTVIVTYQGPSLSTARVKAKIAADQWGRPVDVVDDHWRKIATYEPGSGA